MAYNKFELCIEPDLDIVVWRYMSLQKFEWLLEDKALFFCRADKFSDPFEGTIPKREADYRKKSFDDPQSIKAISNIHRNLKGHFLVNCWHINNAENDAMWRLYLKNNNGVAIKSTVRTLLDSFVNTKEEVNCSIVRYIDYEEDIWSPPTIKGYNMFTPILHKRKEFAQENELRLIHDIGINIYSDNNHYWQKQPKELGKDIRVNLNELINVIYTAPTSNENQIAKIKQIVKKNGFNFQVERSELDNEPCY